MSRAQFRPWFWLFCGAFSFGRPHPAAAQVACPSCQPYAVSVSPAPGTAAHPLNTGSWTVTFTVQNTGNLDDQYDFSCSITGGITCSNVSPASAPLTSLQSVQVVVTYSVGGTVGDVRLTATGVEGAAHNTGWFTVSANPTVALVVPILTSGSRAVVRNRQPVIRATYATNGSAIDTTQTVLKWRGETD